MTPPEPRPLETERLRTMFRERGWSIVMDDRPGQSFDPFVDLAALTPAAEAGPEPGLREAAQAVVDHYERYKVGTDEEWWPVIAPLRAILATPAAEAGPKPGLDVERLAEAAYRDRPPTGLRPVPWTPVKRREWRAWAGRIQAALREPRS